MDSLVSTLSSFSLEDPWRLWLYECNDFPQHCPPRRNIENVLKIIFDFNFVKNLLREVALLASIFVDFV